MAKSYAEIRREQELFRKEDLSSEQFAQLMNRITGGHQYDAALGSGLGKGLKYVSYGIDQLLEGSGMTRAAGNLGAMLPFGEAGRHAFQGLPRAIVDMSPFGLGTKGGVLAGAAMMGTNTYEKTNSPMAGVVGGGSALLFPAAGRLGARSAERLAGRYLPTNVTQRAGYNSLGLLTGEAAAGATNMLTRGGVYKSAAMRAAEFAGEQAGFLGANVLTGATTSAIAAPTGQKWDAFSAAFRPENLAVTALSQLPFMVQPVRKLAADAKEVKFVKDYAQTYAKYDREVWEPQRRAVFEEQARAQLRQAVEQRMSTTQKALPYRAEVTAPVRSGVLAEREAVARNEAIRDVDVQTALTPALKKRQSKLQADLAKARKTGNVALINEAERQIKNFNVDAFATIKLGFSGDTLLDRVAQELPPETLEKLGGVDAPLDRRLQSLNSTEPDVRLGASLLETKTKPATAAKQVGAKVKRGVPVEDATAEVAARLQKQALREAEKAKRAEEAQTRAATRQAERDQATNDFVESWMKTAPKEHQDVFKAALGSLGPSSDPKATTRVSAALRSWVAKGQPEGVEGLSKALKQSAAQQNKRAVDHKSRTVVATFKTPAEAKRAAAERNSDEPEFSWTADGNRLVRREFADRGVQSGRTEAVTSGELEGRAFEDDAPDVNELHKEVETAIDSLIEHHSEEDGANVAKEALSPEAYAGRLTDNEAGMLGEGDAPLGRLRIAAFLQRMQTGLENFRENQMVKLWDGPREFVAWANAFGIPREAAYVRSLPSNLVSAPTGKKFLGTVGEYPAGGGFWYNLGRVDPKANKIGEYPLPKNGVVTEAAFIAIARGVKGGASKPLPKDELALYKMLVPDAFVEAGKVDVYKLAEGLRKAEPSAIGGLPMGDPVQPPRYIGTRETLGGLLQNVGLANHVDEASVLLSLFDRGDLAFAQLRGEQNPLGLFTAQRDGQKLVWLAASADPANRKLFALTHEFAGHYLWELANAGKLDAETTQRLNAYRDMVATNAPEENRIILQELWETLPDKYKKDAGLKALVEQSVADPEEVLANLNAMTALSLVHSNRSTWKNVMQWMPKPLADFVAAIGRWGRKFYEAISGVLFGRKLGVVEGPLDEASRKALHGYIDTLHEVLKYDAQRAKLAKQATRLEMATSTPRQFSQALSSGKMFTEGPDSLVQRFDGETKSVTTADSNRYKKASAAVEYWLGRMEAIGARFGDLNLNHTATQAARRQAMVALLEARAMQHLGSSPKGLKYVSDKDHSVVKIASNDRLAKVRDLLDARSQLNEGKSLAELEQTDAETKSLMAKLSPSEQVLMRDNALRLEAFQKEQVDIIRQMKYETLVHTVQTLKMHADAEKTMRPDNAEKQARAVVEAVMAGKPLGDAHDTFVSEEAAKIETEIEKYRKAANFVSYKRFGDWSIRVEHADGSPPEALPFETKVAREKWMLENKAAIDGRQLSWSPLKRNLAGFTVEDKLLQHITEYERDHRASFVESLTRMGIDPEVAQRWATERSLIGEITKELAAKKTPSMSVHRKFVKGYENMDSLYQRVEYTQMLVRALTKQVAQAEFQARMLDPKFAELEPAVQEQFKQSWKNYLSADSAAVRAINNANYVQYLGLNTVNFLQDAAQPLMGALWSHLIADHGGVIKSGGRIMGAMRDVGRWKAGKTKGLEKDEVALLDDYGKKNRGLASFSDGESNDLLKIHNLGLIAKGVQPETMGQAIKRGAMASLLAVKNLHKHFTNFGMESALLTAYRHYRRAGKDGKPMMSVEDAARNAFNMATLSMGAGGKGGRQAGLWASDKLKPVSAMVTGLQSFAFNQMGSWKGFLDRALGQVPGMTPADRGAALKAFGVHSGLMIAQAGVFGLPLVAALMALIDNRFGVNSKEWLAKNIQDWFGSEDDHLVQQVAMHGLVNALGGVDYASRAQLPGVLGLNARDGFSPESLLGPTYSIIQNVFGAVPGLLSEGPSDLIHRLPNSLKHGLQAWRDDFEFRYQSGAHKGEMIGESNTAQQAVFAVFGLKPTEIANRIERDTWQAIDADIETRERMDWMDELADLYEEGDMQGVRTAIAERVADRPNTSPAAIADSLVEHVINRSMPRDVSRGAGNSEALNKATGIKPNTLSEVQRLQLTQALQTQLGVGLAPQRSAWQRAQMIDQVRLQQPWLSHEEAGQVIDMQTGAMQRRSMRGLR